MSLRISTVKQLILIAAVVGSLVLFTGAYVIVTMVYNRTVHEDARNVSDLIAGQTFNSMFQVMRKGWKRSDVDMFIGAMREQFHKTPYFLEIYRGPKVRHFLER